MKVGYSIIPARLQPIGRFPSNPLKAPSNIIILILDPKLTNLIIIVCNLNLISGFLVTLEVSELLVGIVRVGLV